MNQVVSRCSVYLERLLKLTVHSQAAGKLLEECGRDTVAIGEVLTCYICRWDDCLSWQNRADFSTASS